MFKSRNRNRNRYPNSNRYRNPNPNRPSSEIPNSPPMSLGHEKLDVYQLAINYVAWVFSCSENLTGIHRHARDQWLRASQSIPLNIAEGNAKATPADRRKFFEIARGSALECAAIQDVLRISNALDQHQHESIKREIDRMSIMLSRLGGRGFTLEETRTDYENESDFDSDFDSDSAINPNKNFRTT